MADKIVSCSAIKNSEEDILQYDVAYEVENGANINQFCVTILASEMTDATDAAEAKTKANVKAAAIKTAWIAQEVTTQEAVESVVGDVTL